MHTDSVFSWEFSTKKHKQYLNQNQQLKSAVKMIEQYLQTQKLSIKQKGNRKYQQLLGCSSIGRQSSTHTQCMNMVSSNLIDCCFIILSLKYEIINAEQI